MKRLMEWLTFDRWHCVMSTTSLTTLTTLPLRNVNCFAAQLQFIVCTASAWGRWGEGITMHTSLHKFILPRIASCTLRWPSPHSPCRVLLATAAPQTVQIVIMWTARRRRLLVGRSSENVSHRVSRPKKISPDNDTTQYMQISPSSQYPNTGIVRTLIKNSTYWTFIPEAKEAERSRP